MTALILSRAEYLVILDILHVKHIFGLEDRSLIPADRETHLQLIHEGIGQLKSRGLVKIEFGRHIIERRLLETVSVVARPQVVITTIRDRLGIGAQLYLHYEAHGHVVEQMLPNEDQISLGQLPDIHSAMDRIVRILNLPDGRCTYHRPRTITRANLLQTHTLLESGDSSSALRSLTNLGWTASFAAGYLATHTNRQMSGLVNLMAPKGGGPGASRDLTLIQSNDETWLLTSRPDGRNQLFVRQANAASFRKVLETGYGIVLGHTESQLL